MSNLHPLFKIHLFSTVLQKQKIPHLYLKIHGTGLTRRINKYILQWEKNIPVGVTPLETVSSRVVKQQVLVDQIVCQIFLFPVNSIFFNTWCPTHATSHDTHVYKMGSNLAMSDDTHDVMGSIPCSGPKRKKTKNSLTCYDAMEPHRMGQFSIGQIKDLQIWFKFSLSLRFVKC